MTIFACLKNVWRLYLWLTKMDYSRYKKRSKPMRQLVSIDTGLIKVRPVTNLEVEPINDVFRRSTVKPRKMVSDFVPMVKTKSEITVLPEIKLVIASAIEVTEPVIPETQPSVGSPIDMELPGEASDNQTIKKLKSRRAAVIRLWVIRASLIILVIVFASGGIVFSKGYVKIHKAFKGNALSIAALKTNVLPDLLKGEGDGRINILLLGRGGGAHDAPDLTDTMILASVDPVNLTATLISIPRDLWVQVAGQGSMKINAAWETGEFKYLGKVAPGSTNPEAIKSGFEEVDKIVANVMGVPINYNVIVDFQAFKQAVDVIGGITINVPEDLYDPTMAWENKWNPILAKAGVQNFNGAQALIYVRSRETSSDFARSLRQRTVMLAIKAKAETVGTLSNPIKMSGLVNAFGNNISTDLSLSDASRLYSIIKQVLEASITSVGLADSPNNFITTGPMNGQSIALPRAGLYDYNPIQAFIRTQLKDGYILKENAKVLVLNGTTAPNLATTKAAELITYGYNVVATGDAPHVGWVQTTLVDLTNGQAKYTKNYLEKRYGITAMTTLPDASIQTNGADFVIIIGSNESSTPKT